MVFWTKRHVRKSRRDPRDRDVQRAMLRGMEDGFWLPSWASAVEEEGERLPRSITRQTANAPPPSVLQFVAKFVSDLRAVNGGRGLKEIYAAASRADGHPVDPESLGYYLAMQAQGHGVSWFDDHAHFPIVLPRVEVYAFRTNRGDWDLEGSSSKRLANVG